MKGYQGASLGFPPAWEPESAARVAPIFELPYSAAEIEEYLKNCHYHLLLKEPPTKFAFAGVAIDRSEIDRRFWGVRCRDESDRIWFVFIGSGRSFFRPDRYMCRWMLGILPDGSLSLKQMFEAEIAAQIAHDERKRTEVG